MPQDKNGVDLRVGDTVSIEATVTGFMEPCDGSVYLSTAKQRRVNVLADDVTSVTEAEKQKAEAVDKERKEKNAAVAKEEKMAAVAGKSGELKK